MINAFKNFILFVSGLLFQTYVLMLCWEWFILSLGIRILSITEAIGIILIVSLVSNVSNINISKDFEKEYSHYALNHLIKVSTILFIAFVVHTFM